MALVSKDTRQKNPKAYTVGLNYTPVPLLTLGTDYRKSGGHDDLQLTAQFTFNFGQPWAEQLSPAGVAFARSLAGSRLDLVERNNTIVLDYRKQALVKLALPAEIRGRSLSVQPLNAVVSAKYGVDHIEWQAAALEAAGGKVIPTGPQSGQIQLPAYQANGTNRYPLTGVAYDRKGNASPVAESDVQVDGAGVDVNRSTVTLPLDNLPANGTATTQITLSVRDAQGNLIPGLAPVIKLPFSFTPLTTAMNTNTSTGGQLWDTLSGLLMSSAMADMPVALANGGVTLSEVKETETAGVYTATLTAGVIPGTLSITPQIDSVNFPTKSLILGLDTASLVPGPVSPPVVNPVADGHTVSVTVPVTGKDGKPVKNHPVTLNVNGTDQHVITDDKGNAIVQLPGQSTPGDTRYTIIINGHSQTVTVHFDPVTAGTGMVFGAAPAPVDIIADGTATGHLTFTVRDNQGKPLAGQDVGFTLAGKVAGNDKTSAAGQVTLPLQKLILGQQDQAFFERQFIVGLGCFTLTPLTHCRRWKPL